MEKKQNTYELVEEKKVISEILEILSDDEDYSDEDIEQYQQKLEKVEKLLVQKAERIDFVLLRLEAGKNELRAYVESLEAEASLMKDKIKRLDNNKDRIYKEILPMLVDEDGRLTTKYHKYTIYEGDGSLDIIDETKVPEEYVKTTIEKKIDKKELKKFIKSNGDTDYAKLPKVKRVRKT